MASGRNKKRRDIIADRLSNLPDDVIYKILSFVGVKDRVRTGSLSSRWRYLWTSMPFLYFSSHNFPLIHNFYQSALNVLSNRDNQIQVSSLYLRIFEVPDDAFVNRVLDYAFSHNVQELTVGCEKEFHLFNFSSQSLKVLTLASIGFEYSSTRTSDWELPALTTLHLIGVTLYEEDFELEDYEDVRESWDEFFSKCPNLKNLTFKDCSIGSCGFTICHPHLHNLTLANGDWGLTTFTVDTPQLKTLSIINCGYVELLSAPHLTSFIYRHFNAFEFDVESLPSLEKVDFCICKPHEGNMKDIVDVLQKFQSVKFLTINAEISELLSSELELISNRHSPFANLTSLKIYPAIIDELEEYDYHNDNDDDDDDEYEFKYELKYEDEDENEDEHEEEDEDKEEAEGERDEDKDEDEEEDGDEEEDEDDEEEDGDEDDEVNIEVKNFFLNSSPSATVTKVTREEIRAVTTPELAINLLKELQVLLKEEKAKIIMARKKQGKAPMKSHATELHQQVCSTEERMISTESRWEDPSVQHYLEIRKIGPMVSKLQAIKGVLATLPTSKRAVMKAVFHRVFAEANLVMKKIEDANSHNIGEEHVEEKLPQNQKEFVPTQGRWGKSYKRQWRKRYSRRPKQQGPLISE